MSKTKNQSLLTSKDISTIKAMITYMLTEEDINKVDDKFADKLFDLEEKINKLVC